MKKYLCILSVLAVLLLTPSCEKPGPNPNPDDNDTTLVVTKEYTPIKIKHKEWDSRKRATISYQMLMYSFADKNGDGWGDIQGLTDKLDYINSLGVSAIWISPIHPAMTYHGYDVLDFTALNEKYGTMDDFRNLVQAAHERGIKIYLDFVLNHVGKDHPWFKTAYSSTENPYRDFFIFSEDPKKDIAEGKIPMIATQGADGYDAGQWFSISSTESAKYLFRLNWSNPSAPTITVTPSSTVDPDNPDASALNAKYLYWGDPANCKKFYDKGNGIYELNVDFSSPWGFLIRTASGDDWTLGTKYGATGSTTSITFGVPFKLGTSTTDNGAVLDVQMPGSIKYHSHFWTSWFADLNYGAAATAETSPAFKAMTDAAKGWIDAGVDGFRLDAVKHIYHNEFSGENPQFLKKFYDEMNTYFHQTHTEDIYMVGEVFSEAEVVAPYYNGLPAFFEFSFWWRVKEAITSGKGNTLVSRLLDYQQKYRNVKEGFISAPKLSNHDEDRAGSDLGKSPAMEKLAGAMLLTTVGSPYIYYGEELGYFGTKSGGDEYVRSPMYWGDSYTTSYTTKIDTELPGTIKTVASQMSDTTSVYETYRLFAEARNTYPALAYGVMEAHPKLNATNGPAAISAWYRTYEGEKMLVIHNMSASSITVNIDDPLKAAVVSQGSTLIRSTTAGVYQLWVGGYSSIVFELHK